MGDAPGVCSPNLSPLISVLQGFLVEFLISLILVFVFCGVIDKRNKHNTDTIPVRFGMTVAGLAMVAVSIRQLLFARNYELKFFCKIPYTGAHMNPARTLGPAIINGDFNTNDWVH